MAAGELRVMLRKFCILLVTAVFLTVSMVVSASALSIKKEREVGERLLFEVRKAFPLLDDPDLVQYINALGQQVLDVAGPQYFQYRYYLIDRPEFNAFAAPSGMIFFFSGLILKMSSEDELVAVLAHETAHVVKRHIAAGARTGAYTNAAAMGLAILGATIGGSAGPALMTSALAAGQSVNLHYSREHEQEADLCAYEWMRKMGRDPVAELNMLKVMRRIARYRSQKLPQYLLTHPNPEARMAVIESFLDRDGAAEDSAGTDNFAFLRFKYRILAKVKDTALVRAYLQGLLMRTDTSKQQRAMAEFGLSQLAREEKDYATALSLIRKVRTVFPGKNVLAVDQGIIEADSGDTGQALKTLSVAVAEDGRNLYGCFALGKLLQRLGRYDDAEEYFARVQLYMPEYPQLFFEWGQLENARGNKALSMFYLAKFNLYEGKLKLAAEQLRQSMQEKKLPPEKKREAEELLAQIKRVKKKS